jgi:hypothetical protein
VTHSSGGWKTEKPKMITKGKQILVATEKCLAKIPLINMKILFYIIYAVELGYNVIKGTLKIVSL